MKILSRLDEAPTHGYQLHTELGLTTATIYQHLEELSGAGMVERLTDTGPRKKTKYRLTSDGELLLELLNQNTTEE